MTHTHLGHALLATGMSEPALDAFHRGAALGGVVDSAQLAYALSVTGQRDAANAVVRAVLRQKRDVYNFASAMSLAYLGLGAREEALRWLDRIDEGSGNPTYLRLPAMAPLRAEPRFQRALRLYARTP